MSNGKVGMTRREVFRLGAAAGALFVCRPAHAARAPGLIFQAADAATDVDHIMWGVRDLDEGIQFIEENWGVRAVFGGVHPNRGTQNAIVSLGETTYLEILALDPAQSVENERVAQLRGLTEPTIFTWAARTRDIEAMEKRVKAAGYRSGGLRAGSREKPDGSMLRWKNFYVEGHEGGVVPFVIQWSKVSVHPAADSPKGCQLKTLRLEHPESEVMNGFLEAMGLRARVAQGSKPKITALIETPKGDFELT